MSESDVTGTPRIILKVELTKVEEQLLMQHANHYEASGRSPETIGGKWTGVMVKAFLKHTEAEKHRKPKEHFIEV